MQTEGGNFGQKNLSERLGKQSQMAWPSRFDTKKRFFASLKPPHLPSPTLAPSCFPK